jgi:hypothetical protein
VETAEEGFRLNSAGLHSYPMTLSSVIYYCGFNPYTGEKIYSANQPKDREEQRSFFLLVQG